MRTILKNISLAAILPAVILLPSCSDDESTPIGKAPEITLASSATSTTVWNTVKLTATATADQGIDKIEIKIDGTSIGTATTSPYEFSWDTQKVSDGPHTAIAIVTDQTGGEKTAELKVTVQNILLEAKVDAHMLRTKEDYGYDERGFIFLSDDQGKVIIAQEFKNGDAISLTAPTFEGSEFSISQVVTQPWNSDVTSSAIITTTRVSRGKWVLASYSQTGTGITTASLAFVNRNTDLDYELTSNWANYYLNGTEIEGVNLRPSPSLLYVTSQPKNGSGIPKYHVFPSIVTGANPNALDLALVDKTLTEEIITLPEDRPTGFVMLYGLHTVNGASQLYDIGLYGGDDQGKMSIQYPAEGFDSFYSSTRLNGQGYYTTNTARQRYDLTPLAATLNASLAGRNVTVAASGTMDLIHFDLYHNQLTWTIIAEKSATSLVIPQIPAILQDVTNLNVDITEAGLTIAAEDYQQVQDYKSYLDFIRASNEGFTDLASDYAERKGLYKYIDNTSGGRLANNKQHDHYRLGDRRPYIPHR